ncbi:hypothetical protein [Candidatus Neoehrlichia procyonis]|nr:hypothetical protein [Candidatus Neoehrlichia lotoris]
MLILLCKEGILAKQNYDKNSARENYQQLRSAVKNQNSRISVYGNALSYIWVTNNKDYSVSDRVISYYSKYRYNSNASLDSWGINNDALLSVSIISKENNDRFVYGAMFQLLMPAMRGRVFYSKLSNKGIIGFINSPHGDLSFGYQEGIESEMKVDAFNIAAGDQSIGWSRYVSGFFVVHDVSVVNNIPCYWSSGLYSENLFRSNGNFIMEDGMLDDRDFINSLPFRISYKSVDIFGLKFGISYSPLGYKEDLLSQRNLRIVSAYDNISLGSLANKDMIVNTVNSQSSRQNNKNNKLTVTKGVNYNVTADIKEVDLLSADTKEIVSGLINKSVSSYKNIISGAIYYDYKINDVRFITSIVGEYAKSDNSKYYVLHDLVGIALGTNIDCGKLKFGAAYGYLGKSGMINYYYYDNQLLKYVPSGHSYYWDVGISYKYNNLLMSAVYFNSSYGGYNTTTNNLLSSEDKHFLRDFSVGFDYAVYSNNKTHYKLFANYHYFIINQSISAAEYVLQGGIFLSGIKLEF